MPMAAMAGTLFIVGMDMIEWRHLKHYAQARPELIIYLSTFICIVFFGLAAGVVAAVFLSISLFMLRISRLDLNLQTTDAGAQLKVKGALFYGSVSHLTEAFHEHAGDNLTLDLEYATYIDQSAEDIIAREARNMAAHGARLTVLMTDKQRNSLKTLGDNSDINVVSLGKE